MISDEQLNRAISQTIAEKIISGLDDEHRAAFLTKAIKEALKGYEVRHAVEKAVADKAARVAQELIEGGEWAEQIRSAVVEGFNSYISVLPAATRSALIESLHGKDGIGYERNCGAILRHLKLPEQK